MTRHTTEDPDQSIDISIMSAPADKSHPAAQIQALKLTHIADSPASKTWHEYDGNRSVLSILSHQSNKSSTASLSTPHKKRLPGSPFSIRNLSPKVLFNRDTMTLKRRVNLTLSFRKKNKDKSKGYDVTTSAGMASPTSHLSARRELVEQLDSEPLFDYLIQNGVLDQAIIDEIRNEKSAAKVNIALLRRLEESGKTAYSLFINALRQTGQHHLANLLDEGKRLSALSGSGYLSKKRHKGQVSLQIEVRAIRLLPETLQKLMGDVTVSTNKRTAHYTLNRDWISLEDIQMRISELSEPHTASLHQVELSEMITTDDSKKKDPSCFCLCFSRLFARRKELPDQNGSQNNGPQKSSSQNINGYRTSPKQQIAKVNKVNNVIANVSHTSIHQAQNSDSLENLRNIADTFRQKADRLYEILRNPESSAYTLLLKYFEQDRGVLVLDTDCAGGFVIVNICMKLEQLEQLQRDYHNGKLTKDIENCVITDEILQQVGLKGIKLCTAVDQDEFEQAEQELG